MNLKLKSVGSDVERCKCFRDDRNHWQKKCFIRNFEKYFFFLQRQDEKNLELVWHHRRFNKQRWANIDSRVLRYDLPLAFDLSGSGCCWRECLSGNFESDNLLSIVNVFLSPMVLRNYLRGPIDLEYEKSKVVMNPSISLLTLHIPKHSFYINLESN